MAVDDGAADAAVTADVDVGKDNAGVHGGVGVDAHILRDHGVGDRGAGDDDAGGNHRVDRHAGAARLTEDKLGRRILAHTGAHGPVLVVEVEDRRNRAEVHIGVVISVERADVAPVERLLLVLVHKAVGHHLLLAKHIGQNVMAEVVF